ncbi:LysE family translocator [Desulfuromonas acetoxidans]|uniref:Lysine exporter protein (LYSE/YGGA) n=1 Tax=Desulfuromonas acetoxidans (strain DSM 684 / 11070) TaxID=281689 RepID=Q1JYI2_DESA6|nr:LysE family translocator [Desulfuromonas acetoxidans]EAT15224.1 Lysine exporter protein (LYSE/YGGA) [Desulfuromonas acetoxidans DSM 684]MBF0646686.1 LysE family translocator [Desulfuromonas acetoxidans]NVD25994.1 LysE family translocator [Desulfuromonas acetoxidans]NVE17898.1 LysE family translocator [Desulfuromonas acetoxidans]
MFSSEFLLTSLVVVLIPGTGVIYTVSTGLFHSRRASIAAACGCTAGIVPHLTASILGLSAILHMSAVAFQAVKYAGVLYLLYLSWSMWRETGLLQVNAPESARSLRHVAIKGFLINILNPKLSIFFLAFLPLFVAPDSASPALQMLILSGLFMLMTLVVFILYGLLATSVRRYIVNSSKITGFLQKSFAAIFAALGLKLALTER